MVSLDEKIEASIMLGAYLDTIGFKNGVWEFNKSIKLSNWSIASGVWLDIIFEYYSLGGPDLNIKNWKVSDDTLLMMATGKACLKNGGIQNYLDEYLNIYDDLAENIRCSGANTIQTLALINKLIKNNKFNIDKLPINDEMGGNGAAIRTSIIGIKWYNDEEKIIEESIKASRLTHNIPIGYLGGMVTALFTSYAIKNISPFKWVDNLIELYKTKKIHKSLAHVNDPELNNKINRFFLYWMKYKEERLSQMDFRGKLIFSFVKDRYYDLINYCPIYTDPNKRPYFDFSNVGSTGIDVLIWAYDALLLSIIPNDINYIDFDNLKYNFNNLTFFSAINIGDSDSIGIIAGCWYGALLGYDGVNKEKIINIEFYNELKKLSNNISKQIIN
jgi:ADP-ribosylarginine hydrolase